jgi:hypothetical protein
MSNRILFNLDNILKKGKLTEMPPDVEEELINFISDTQSLMNNNLLSREDALVLESEMLIHHAIAISPELDILIKLKLDLMRRVNDSFINNEISLRCYDYIVVKLSKGFSLKLTDKSGDIGITSTTNTSTQPVAELQDKEPLFDFEKYLSLENRMIELLTEKESGSYDHGKWLEKVHILLNDTEVAIDSGVIPYATIITFSVSLGVVSHDSKNKSIK